VGDEKKTFGKLMVPLPPAARIDEDAACKVPARYFYLDIVRTHHTTWPHIIRAICYSTYNEALSDIKGRIFLSPLHVQKIMIHCYERPLERNERENGNVRRVEKNLKGLRRQQRVHNFCVLDL
jgi:hypothetical protein